MTDDHPALQDYPIDEDYVEASKKLVSGDGPQRADLSYMESDEDEEDDTQQASETDGDILMRSERLATDDTSMQFSQMPGSSSKSSLDEKIDKDAIISNDGRSHTRTMFYPEQAPSNKQYQYSKLAKWNDGMYASDRDTRNKKADNRRWIDAYSGLFEVSDHQQDRVEACIEDIPLRHMAHYTVEQVVLAVMHLVCWEDGRHLCSEPAFDSALCDTGLDMTNLDSIINLTFRKCDMLQTDDFPP